MATVKLPTHTKFGTGGNNGFILVEADDVLDVRSAEKGGGCYVTLDNPTRNIFVPGLNSNVAKALIEKGKSGKWKTPVWNVFLVILAGAIGGVITWLLGK